jgi:hypothetical protein
MTKPFAIGLGLLFLVCILVAANAWLGTPGAASGASGGTIAVLFLALSLAAGGFAFASRDLSSGLGRRRITCPEGLERQRLITAIVYVARTCEGASPRDVAVTYRSFAGVELEKGEIANAVKFLRVSRGAPLDRLLSKVTESDEKQRILGAACQIWSCHGVESERATRAMERVAAALSLEGNDINAALDAASARDTSRLFKDIETIARRTVSRATTGAQRITTRLRGTG